jgi:ligand-binding SRPBCC domain-containing protein
LPRIHLTTEIKNATIEVVFDLIRSIDLHIISSEKSREIAITLRTTGLISLGETVTWQAKHLGFTQELTSKITGYQAPFYFADEMVSGAFKSFRHEHFLSLIDGIVIVKDVFDYCSPFGFLGKIADSIFLRRHMTNFLKERNIVIRDFAESDKWN